MKTKVVQRIADTSITFECFRVCDNGESFYEVAIFDRASVEMLIGEMLRPNEHRRVDEEDELASILTGWCEYYSGVGRWFGRPPVIKVFGNKVMVRQFRGLDI